jgi:hypothetical protein
VVSPTPNPRCWRTSDYTLCGPYTLACLKALSRAYAPASIALRIIGARTPPLLDKAVALEEAERGCTMFLEVFLSSSAKFPGYYLKFVRRFLPRCLITILVDTAATYGLNNPGIRRFDSRKEKNILLFFTASRPALRPIYSPIHGYWGLFPRK